MRIGRRELFVEQIVDMGSLGAHLPRWGLNGLAAMRDGKHIATPFSYRSTKVVVRHPVRARVACYRRRRVHRVTFRLAASRASSFRGAARNTLETSCFSR